MPKNIEEYIVEEVRDFIESEIIQADGNEVFFIGKINDDKIIDQANVFARGNRTEVAAIIKNCRPGDVLIHNHPSGNLTPSNADNAIASQVGNDGVGFLIVNNAADQVYVVVEPAVFEKAKKVDAASLNTYLDDDGPLSKMLQNFEKREPQIRMMETVTQAFNEEKIALIEAGTGTGKTLAYLLPAIAWGLENGKRIVVSTNTINLQQQLIDKDIPLLQSIFPQEFRAELVKGRGNYLCLRKMHEAVEKPATLDFDGTESDLKKIKKWSEKTKDGSRADMGFMPSDQLWEQIKSESDTTLKKRCPFYQQCFFYSARRRAATAEILVANHHLLFADLSVRSAVGNASEIAILPTYDRVILDEAHNLEDVASRYFGVTVTYHGIVRILNRLQRKRKDKVTGLFSAVLHTLNVNSSKIPPDVREEIYDLVTNTALESLDKARTQLNIVVDRVYLWVMTRGESNYAEKKVRITEDVRVSDAWQNAIEGVPFLIRDIVNLADTIQKIVMALLKTKKTLGQEALSLNVDLKAQSDRLLALAQDIDMAIQKKDEKNVRWIETKESRLGQIVRFCTAPINVAPILKHAVFEKFPTVIMTSATLSVGGQFDYFANRFGLDSLPENKRIMKVFQSPFDYKSQVVVGIPIDIAEPNMQPYRAQLRERIEQAIQVAKGETFCLFTSYGLLNDMYDELQLSLENKNFPVLKQGALSRHALLTRFRTEKGSVLFGTDSFWEGVDVQGDALVQVIIPRLPFRVPSEPIIQARIEAIEAEGGNSFMEFSVPQAVLKFKQGFGRLIRTKTDYGVILIFDRRIVTKYYGKIFLKSLPECSVLVGDSKQVITQVDAFLKSKRKRG